MTYRVNNLGSLGDAREALEYWKSLSFLQKFNPLQISTYWRLFNAPKREFGFDENGGNNSGQQGQQPEPKPKKQFPWLLVGAGGVAILGVVGYVAYRKKRKI